MENTPDIQNDYLNKGRKENLRITVFLTNGKKLVGRIKSFDRFAIIVESDRTEQLVFKHAISTVSFSKPTFSNRPAVGQIKPARSSSDSEPGESGGGGQGR